MARVVADERMSDVDALVWAVEQRPRNRTTIAALARFARPLDTGELRHRVDRASRTVPRLRQRVVTDGSDRRWALDPDFQLGFHLRHRRLATGTDRELTHAVRDAMVQPFDRTRPLWEFTHLSGLADGGSALLLKSHHAVTDGVGGVELMLELFDLAPEPTDGRRALPPDPVAGPPSDARPDGGPAAAPEPLLRRVLAGLQTPDLAASRRAGEMLGSAVRVLSPTRGPRRVPSARSDQLDIRFFSLPLAGLRHAGQRVGGTINDAFLAGVSLGIADHTRDSSAPLHISVPMSTRREDDGVGNHWALGRLTVDLDATSDPDELAAHIRPRMRRLRREPANDLLPPLATGLRHLPDPAVAAAFDAVATGADVAASNVPGSPTPLHLCGEPVDALVGLGPLSGCAINVTLLSHADEAHIGISSDPAAIPDADRLASDLEHGFTAVVKGS